MPETLPSSKKLTKKEYEEQLGELQARLLALEFRIFREQVPVLCVFEGMDAAGKGGAIQRLTAPLDPRGFTVSSFAAPAGEDKTHHYLWRFWRNLPRAGHLGIFDRSYYGRVLVERVEGFCREDEWRRAYREIAEFEFHQHSFGMVICKFWLQISRREQLRRFESREFDLFRSYKLTEEDWRNRSRWDQYQVAAKDMLRLTHKAYAPWSVVEANDKPYARVKVLRTVVEAIEKRLGR